MRESLFPLWGTRVVLWLSLLLLGGGEAQVHTEVQVGPLYRVVGAPLSIFCSTSGFQIESSEKQFEFSISKPFRGDINIISTGDDSFGYAVYQTRVMAKDITVRRVSPNSVFFEIQSLQKEDEGEYHCTVKNSEYIYNGKYSDSTTVKVIDNSLSVLSPVSTSLSFDQGDALTLSCQAFSNTTQHTHLSFAWYLYKDGEDVAQPIISLERDFTLKPGPDFESRYHGGLISLDKLGSATFKLKIDHLEVSDQGSIYCQAQEWIEDPDGSWYSIAGMKGTEIPLKVKASEEVTPDATSLLVQILSEKTTLQEEQELPISCKINSRKPEGRFFSVAWLQGAVELARMGPTGILSVGSEYVGREMKRELRVTRTGNRDYNLILQSVRLEDQGEYKCRAWPEVRGPDGSFTQGEPVDSDPHLVKIFAAENELTIQMNNFVTVTEGGSLRLKCKADGGKGQLYVTWQHKSSSAAPFTPVISLRQDGVVQISEGFTNRRVRATRPAADVFILELDEVRTTDAGQYQCVVSQRMTNLQTHDQSQTATVAVSPFEMNMFLMSRNSKVTVGDNVELICRIEGPRAPITVTWSLQRDTTALAEILTVSSDGAIRWFVKQHRYQVKVETSKNNVIHYLQIIGASQREAGSYYCGLNVHVANASKTFPLSNPVAIVVKNPESKLALSLSSKIEGNINADIEIQCYVTSKSSTFALYDVTWLRHDAANKTIVHSDRNAFLMFGPQMEFTSRQRISMRRVSGPSFVLTLRQAKVSDRGSYVCAVGEWLQDPDGVWYQLSMVSQTTQLMLTEPDNNLQLDKTRQLLVAKETEDVELKCDIISGANAPSIFYKVTWLHTAPSPIKRNVSLVELDHTGLLRYPEDQSIPKLRSRLSLSRPSYNSFILKIHNVLELDSGVYWCQVEQYQLDLGRWKQKASDITGPVTLRVNISENNLSLVKTEKECNVTILQDFTLPCHVVQQSSNESKFHVTWFWQKTTESVHSPIFTVYRNFTLQNKSGRSVSLRFGHPLPGHYDLTILNIVPENSGVYFCEVEEWLSSLNGEWRKVGMVQSGKLTINVDTEGNAKARSESECHSMIWIIVTVLTVLSSLFVIFLLVWKICRNAASVRKKAEKPLWKEQLSLTATN